MYLQRRHDAEMSVQGWENLPSLFQELYLAPPSSCSLHPTQIKPLRANTLQSENRQYNKNISRTDHNVKVRCYIFRVGGRSHKNQQAAAE